MFSNFAIIVNSKNLLYLIEVKQVVKIKNEANKNKRYT